MLTSSVIVPSPISYSFSASSIIPNFGESRKLDGANYPLWKVKIHSHLVAWKLWQHVTGRDPKPEDLLIASGHLLQPADRDEQEA